MQPNPHPTPKLDDEGNIDRKVSARDRASKMGDRDEIDGCAVALEDVMMTDHLGGTTCYDGRDDRRIHIVHGASGGICIQYQMDPRVFLAWDGTQSVGPSIPSSSLASPSPSASICNSAQQAKTASHSTPLLTCLTEQSKSECSSISSAAAAAAIDANALPPVLKRRILRPEIYAGGPAEAPAGALR